MANDLYTTKTAALKATFVDARVIDAKKIKIKGQDILEKIEGASKTTKHANDTRETITENDLWGQYIETKADGTIIVHDDEVTNPNASNQWSWTSVVTKVQNNEAYENDRLIENEVGGYKQFPLNLGYAMTIHKAQGKTLDAVVVDAARGCFAHGQAYVALSRTRKSTDMHVASALQPRDVIFDKRVLDFVNDL